MNVSPVPSALASAVNALRVNGRKVDQAAADIARIGLPTDATDAPPVSGDATVPAVDLADAELRMLLAQRAFFAQLRTLRTVDAMMAETLRLSGD